MDLQARTDEVVLFQTDDRHKLDELQRAVEAAAARSKTPLRIGDDDAVREAARAYDDFKTEAAERGVKVGINALGRRVWRTHVKANPPREKNAEDEEWGFNYETLCDDVVSPCVVSVSGKPIDGDAREKFLDALTDGDFSRIYSAVVRLNTGRGPDPKASLLAMLPQSSAETSESPERLG